MKRKPYNEQEQLSNLNKIEKLTDFNIAHWNELSGKNKLRTLTTVITLPALWELHKLATWLENKEKK